MTTSHSSGGASQAWPPQTSITLFEAAPQLGGILQTDRREGCLIERAADVMLKEKRRLVIVPRETPMSLPQLRNMVLCAEAGAMLLPAMPAFYQQPKTIDDLADFLAGKILTALGFDQHLFAAWDGRVHRTDA